MRVILFGAGVQTWAMALLAERGEIQPFDFGVFADTVAEPRSVYRFMKKHLPSLSNKIWTCSAGNIVDDHLGENKRVANAPFFMKNPEDQKEGRLWRQCTQDYKIYPLNRQIRSLLGYTKGRSSPIDVCYGISTDEASREKISTKKWQRFVYPLLYEKPMDRDQCRNYTNSILNQKPPRSACYFCPNRSDVEWLHLKTTEPNEFKKAVKFEKALQVRKRYDKIPWLHRTCVPINKIDFAKRVAARGENYSIDECDGVCGV